MPSTCIALHTITLKINTESFTELIVNIEFIKRPLGEFNKFNMKFCL